MSLSGKFIFIVALVISSRSLIASDSWKQTVLSVSQEMSQEREALKSVFCQQGDNCADGLTADAGRLLNKSCDVLQARVSGVNPSEIQPISRKAMESLSPAASAMAKGLDSAANAYKSLCVQNLGPEMDGKVKTYHRDCFERLGENNTARERFRDICLSHVKALAFRPAVDLKKIIEQNIASSLDEAVSESRAEATSYSSAVSSNVGLAGSGTCVDKKN